MKGRNYMCFQNNTFQNNTFQTGDIIVIPHEIFTFNSFSQNSANLSSKPLNMSYLRSICNYLLTNNSLFENNKNYISKIINGVIQ
jgi:hypothetical protein